MKLQLYITLLLLFLVAHVSSLHAQVTSASVSGQVVTNQNEELPGANIQLIHEPTGTIYGITSRVDGRFNFSAVRVGGPYTLKVSFVGYKTYELRDINLSLSQNLELKVVLNEETITMEDVVVTAQTDPIMNADKTGASTTIATQSINALPTITRRITDFTRLTPQARGNSFAGVDARLNNIQIDGSSFNNSFGLGAQPGDRTGVAPISIDAIEQISVNIAPYDVRQGGFVGAGINMVTKSGTNNYTGTVYTQLRNQDFVGTKAGKNTVDPGQFKYNQYGFSIGGPIIKNKLFFFTNFETDGVTTPATTFRANSGSETVGGNVTRVLKSDLDQLSAFLREKFGYETGKYEGYDFKKPSLRFLAKFDYNINDRNKFSLRYTHLDSKTDVLASNSSSLGAGRRRTNLDALNFQNTNYKILENIRSIVGELNSTISNTLSNNMIIGFTYQDESRDTEGQIFPLVDILKDGRTYTSFGYEPFTPNNELRYKTFQFQNNVIWSVDKHLLTLGFAAEFYRSENVFFPGSQSVYVYNSLDDFYADANAYLNKTTSDVVVKRFQVRWSNQPNLSKPVQPLEVTTLGFYAQDEFNFTSQFKLTAGLRIDIPIFGDTGFKNEEANSLTFKDENNKDVKYRTEKLPDASIHWSPRLGFNWDVTGKKETQVRGGSGLFTGRPAYVWISNQIGNNGVLTGFLREDNTTNYHFNPDPDFYKPNNVTGAPADRYELALTDPNFKFPQVWRTNVAIDQKLPWYGLILTAEFIYTADINGIYYINANLKPPTGTYSGADQRPYWSGSNKIHSKIDNAIVLKNQNVGRSYNFSLVLEKPFSQGISGKVGYNYGASENTVDPGSIAFGSWNNNPHSGDPNNPGLSNSSNFAGNRFFTALTYTKNFLKIGDTSISLFFEGRNAGVASYVFSGDANGDGGRSNDLIYIPKDRNEMNFEEYTSGSTTFTVDEQKDAWEAFINQDDYLKNNRGKYAKRNGVLLPMVYTMDLSVAQNFEFRLKNTSHKFQLRADIINFTNMLNSDWGIGKTLTTTAPLVFRGTTPDGAMKYRLANFNGELIKKSYQDLATINDVYRVQLSLRYSF